MSFRWNWNAEILAVSTLYTIIWTDGWKKKDWTIANPPGTAFLEDKGGCWVCRLFIRTKNFHLTHHIEKVWVERGRLAYTNTSTYFPQNQRRGWKSPIIFLARVRKGRLGVPCLPVCTRELAVKGVAHAIRWRETHLVEVPLTTGDPCAISKCCRGQEFVRWNGSYMEQFPDFFPKVRNMFAEMSLTWNRFLTFSRRSGICSLKRL